MRSSLNRFLKGMERLKGEESRKKLKKT